MKQVHLSIFAMYAVILSIHPNNRHNGIPQSPFQLSAIGPVSPLQNKPPADSLADFRQLIPLTILHPASSKATDKYGIEFSGYCYECNLAALSLGPKKISFLNVCDKSDVFAIEPISYTLSPGKLSIKTARNEFVFTKVEAIPVYELKITGDKLTLKNKRISHYYTPQKQLTRFKQHDCGGFDG